MKYTIGEIMKGHNRKLMRQRKPPPPKVIEINGGNQPQEPGVAETIEAARRIANSKQQTESQT